MKRNISPGEQKNKIGGTAFDLLDEAYFLLRENLVDILPLHLLAWVPFLLGIMFFIFRFSNFHSLYYVYLSIHSALNQQFCVFYYQKI